MVATNSYFLGSLPLPHVPRTEVEPLLTISVPIFGHHQGMACMHYSWVVGQDLNSQPVLGSRMAYMGGLSLDRGC